MAEFKQIIVWPFKNKQIFDVYHKLNIFLRCYLNLCFSFLKIYWPNFSIQEYYPYTWT